jgi:hypothetical protein
MCEKRRILMFKERFQAIGIHDSGIQEEYVLICMCG